MKTYSLNVLLFDGILKIVTKFLIYKSILCTWINILHAKIIKKNIHDLLVILNFNFGNFLKFSNSKVTKKIDVLISHEVITNTILDRK